MPDQKTLSSSQQEILLQTLNARFDQNLQRHQGISWQQVLDRLKNNKNTLWSLSRMEATGGEPDVVGKDSATGEILFMDCSPQSPEGRRSLCFDEEALAKRKENKPKGSAWGMAKEMGIELLDEAQYRHLQSVAQVDSKTSSWIDTPKDMRQQGGALFGDSRYGQVFFYHNGAESYYAGRGFRGCLRV
jgi:hypothetical protein